MSEVKDQPPPVPRPDLTSIWDGVIADMQALKNVVAVDDGSVICFDRVVTDMQARDRVGRERYGTPLTIHNGRDHLVDLYQELLDAAAYSKAKIMEGGPIVLYSLYRRLLDDLIFIRTLIHESVVRRNA